VIYKELLEFHAITPHRRYNSAIILTLFLHVQRLEVLYKELLDATFADDLESVHERART
jgi:hypothetical protein